MIKTLIIDDEQHCIDRVKKLINNHTDNLQIVGTSSTVDDALKKTIALNPDLVFLDIEIHDKTGFDYLEQLGEFDFNLIFTTAFNNYAIKAFKYSAMDYLLKPIDSDDFIGAIKRLNKRISATDTESQIKLLLNNLKKEDHKKTIRIPTLDGFEIVEIGDIIHCQAETSYTHIFTTQKKHMVSKRLKFYEDLLKDAHFFRIHNSHLVNINHVKKYTKGKGGYVTMSNNSTIDVSTRKKEEFLKLFK
ncbi:LytR/AlgR family response regulator transcription factor [Psychroserpens mesophilus]|uniref:LytR/AlgR family response regulator transcription factor n=1 Tax=Psychroserpens mesophilus TaxID=325473 RepID=UPI00058E12AA|nr:LytTR family DNA-binding domain-containing protein [Psychroserpens mesophilus]